MGTGGRGEHPASAAISGPLASLEVSTLTVTGLTASRLVQSDASKVLTSVSDLTSWVGGTANQVTSTDDGDGTLTLSLPSTLIAPGSIQSTTTVQVGADVVLARDAANTLAQRNAANGQALRVYGTFTDASNYERLAIACDTTSASVVHQIGGTGTSRELVFGTSGASRLRFYTNNTNRVEITSDGHHRPMTDNASDSGGASNSWRNIYAGTQFLGPGGSDSAPDLARQSSTNSGITLLSNGIEIVNAGANTVTIGSNLTMRSAGLIRWSSTSDPSSGTPDVVLARHGVGVLALRDGVNAQTFRIYSGTSTYCEYTGTGLNRQSSGTYTIGANISAFTFAEAVNIAVGTTTGTKIGTATTQKLGFWDATPVVQQAHIADPAGGSTVDAEARTAINAINATMATLGLTAAS